jgi:23S rRNA pseudouridine2605 synthase
MTAQRDASRPGERIAKMMARAGVSSRREAEAWIKEGRVAVNGKVISSPALNVTAADRVTLNGEPLPTRERTRLFLYYKPVGLVTTHVDPAGRPTLFAALPAGLPRLVSVGRLDLNTEGLLLLTNDGGLARVLELPATGWLRRYRVRAHGRVQQDALDRLRRGITIDGVRYGSIEAALDREQGSNVWLTFAMREGKNREVKNVLGHLGLAVNRLIRVSYGPFQLTGLAEGSIEEVKTRVLREQLGERIVAQSGADFSAPVRMESVAPAPSTHRQPEARAPHDAKGGGPKAGGRPSREAKPRTRSDDAQKTARPDKPVRRRRGRSESERFGEPELARREKRHGRKRFAGVKSGGAKSGGAKSPSGKRR